MTANLLSSVRYDCCAFSEILNICIKSFIHYIAYYLIYFHIAIILINRVIESTLLLPRYRIELEIQL